MRTPDVKKKGKTKADPGAIQFIRSWWNLVEKFCIV